MKLTFPDLTAGAQSRPPSTLMPGGHWERSRAVGARTCDDGKDRAISPASPGIHGIALFRTRLRPIAKCTGFQCLFWPREATKS